MSNSKKFVPKQEDTPTGKEAQAKFFFGLPEKEQTYDVFETLMGESITTGYIVEHCTRLFGFLPQFDDRCRLVGKLNPWTHDPKKVFTKVYAPDTPWYHPLSQEIIDEHNVSGQTSHISSTGRRLSNVPSAQIVASCNSGTRQGCPTTPVKPAHNASSRASSSEAPDSELERVARCRTPSSDPYQPSSPTPIPRSFIPALILPKKRSLATSLSLSSTESFTVGPKRRRHSRVIPRQGLTAAESELGDHSADLGVSDWFWDMQKHVEKVENTGAELANTIRSLQDHSTTDLNLEQVQEALLNITTAVSGLKSWSTHTPARWRFDDHHEITWEWRQTDGRRQQLQQLLVDNSIPVPPPYEDLADGPAQIDKSSYEDPPTLRELREMWEEDEDNKRLWEASRSPRAQLNFLSDIY